MPCPPPLTTSVSTFLRQLPIHRISPSSIHSKHQQPAHNRGILQKVDHLRLLLHPLHRPEIVKKVGHRNQIQEQQPSREPRLESRQNRQATRQLHGRRQRDEHAGRRQVHSRRITHNLRVTAHLEESADQKYYADQNPSRQRS